MKLRKEIQYYDTGEIFSIKLKDENNITQGEFISYYKDGSTYVKGFLKDGWLIGKYYDGGEYVFYSIISPGNEISEQKHKKELAMIRFGLTKEPKAFSYLLKDYDENGKIK